MIRFLHLLSQCLYPPLCRNCGVDVLQNDIFCDNCISSVKPIVSVFFPVTRRLSIQVFSVSDYAGPLRTLVLKKFYSDVLASKQLARLILTFTPIASRKVDLIVPVPLHWTRYSFRGFNQAHEMAKVIAQSLNVPVVSMVSRVRRTPFQSRLSMKDRAENIKNAFGLSWRYKAKLDNYIQGKHVVLVDDLCTTGATLIQVAKVIAPYRPASLTAVVGCRVV